MRPAAVLEKGDVGRARAPGPPGHQVREIAKHVGAGNDAPGERIAQLADMRDRGVETVDEDPRPPERLVVGLAHVGAIGADQVEMLAGPEPRALQDGLGGGGGGRDDVRGGDGGGQVGDSLGTGRGGEHGRRRGRAAPERDRDAGKSGAVGVDQRGRNAAGAEDQKSSRVRPGEQAGAEQRIRGGLPAGDERGVDHCRERAGGIVEKQQRALNRRPALRGIAGKDRHRLGRRAEPVDPGGPVQQRVGAAGQHLVGHARRWAAVAVRQRLGHRHPVEAVLDVPRNDPGDVRHQAPTATSALASLSSPSAGRPAMFTRLSPTT